MMSRKKDKRFRQFLGARIRPNCEYCQNCVIEGGKNFCTVKKSIDKKGMCKKFDYNPVMRKVTPPVMLEKFDESDFTL